MSGGIALLLSAAASPCALAEDKTSSGEATAIQFSKVAPSVAAKMKQVNEDMRWQCTGGSMFDCDGERAAKAEAQYEEIRKGFLENKADQ